MSWYHSTHTDAAAARNGEAAALNEYFHKRLPTLGPARRQVCMCVRGVFVCVRGMSVYVCGMCVCTRSSASCVGICTFVLVKHERQPTMMLLRPFFFFANTAAACWQFYLLY
jgi:hypothetical protein